MIIRKVKEEDLPAIDRIFDSAKEYMKNSGNPNQWPGEYPGSADVIENMKKGEAFVIEDGGEVHAAFCFVLGPDPTYETAYLEGGSWTNDRLYGTVHRIASDGKLRGVFNAALDFCIAIHPNIRIDTHEDNLIMQKHILDGGFIPCGLLHRVDGSTRLAYQRDFEE